MKSEISKLGQIFFLAAVSAGVFVLGPGGGSAQTRNDARVDKNSETAARMETAPALGAQKDLEEARKCFEREARKGYAPAEVNLAVFYIRGWGGVEQNYGAALYWLKDAAKRGQPRAYVNLGILYLKGWGVPQDNGEALKNFRIAAAHGETGAMVDLGYMTESGMGTAKDPAEGAEWYERAAERGDAWGQNNLADAYLRGIGVAQSDAKAAAWFLKAAEQGHTGARIKLGFLYLTGRGVGKDPVTAYSWILAASGAGDHRGDQYLAALQGQLEAEQREAATRRARELQAARLDPSPLETAFMH